MRYAMYHDASPDVADNKKAQSEPAESAMDVVDEESSHAPEDSQVSVVEDGDRASTTRYALPRPR
jgi:hypothetical protein